MLEKELEEVYQKEDEAIHELYDMLPQFTATFHLVTKLIKEYDRRSADRRKIQKQQLKRIDSTVIQFPGSNT